MISRVVIVLVIGLLCGCISAAAAPHESLNRDRNVYTADGAAVAVGSNINSETDATMYTIESTHTNAEIMALLAEFRKTAEAIYQGALYGDRMGVRKLMEQLETQFKEIPVGQYTTVEGVRALTNSIVEAKRTINNVQINQQHWEEVTSKLRLTVDALTNVNEPMWLTYYKVFEEDFATMKRAATLKDKSVLQHAYHQLQAHYQLIRPAAIVQRDPTSIEKVDSYFALLNTAIMKPAGSSSAVTEAEAVAIGVPVIRELFMMSEDAPTIVPPIGGDDLWLWTLGIGAVLITVLTYVGFRKYRGVQRVNRKAPLIDDEQHC